MLTEAKVIYFWYYGGMKVDDQQKVKEALHNKDFELFDKMIEKYPQQLPLTASIFLDRELIGEIDITTSTGFNLIDIEDSEHG